MKVSRTLKKACEVLRRKVRFMDASFRLPGTPFEENDAPKVREVTRLYVESWIVPIIDAIEKGDTGVLAYLTEKEPGALYNSK